MMVASEIKREIESSTRGRFIYIGVIGRIKAKELMRLMRLSKVNMNNI